MRLLDVIDGWFDRMELRIVGLDRLVEQGQRALAQADGVEALAIARDLATRAPDSAIAIALLADATELAELFAEHGEAMERLAELVPANAGVWLRLARARTRCGAGPDPIREAYERSLGLGPTEAEQREALLGLADLDIGAAEPRRALFWLSRLADPNEPEARLRRAECLSLLAKPREALDAFGSDSFGTLHARAARVRGQLRAALGDTRAFADLVRATIMDEPGASRALAMALAWLPSTDELTRRIRELAEARGELDAPIWRAAFALASGDTDRAIVALCDAGADEGSEIGQMLLDVSLRAHSAKGLRHALGSTPETPAAEPPTRVDGRRLLHAIDALDDTSCRAWESAERALAILSEVRDGPNTGAWARELVLRALTSLPLDDPASGGFDLLIRRLGAHAQTLGDFRAIGNLAAIERERRLPLRLAVAGEFNAGKSTLINALLGQAIAPMGIVPTTGTIYHFRHATEPVALIHFRDREAESEAVPVARLQAKTASAELEAIDRIEVRLPLDGLRTVEIIDTPGLNAPDAHHARASDRAVSTADAVLFVLDASSPVKQTELVSIARIQAACRPIFFVINKLDRIEEHGRDEVFAHVAAALESAGVVHDSPIAAVAAKPALDAMQSGEPLERSGWPEVRGWLDRHVLGRGPSLKARSLTEALRQIAAQLLEASSTLAMQAEERRRDHAKRADAWLELASKLERNPLTASMRLAARLEPPITAWTEDAARVAASAGAPARPEAGKTARSVHAYRLEGAVRVIGPAIASACAELTDKAPVERLRFDRGARAIARAITNFKAPAEATQAAADAALGLVVDELEALARERDPGPDPDVLARRELGCLASLNKPMK